jgi:hypothetical protein
MAVTIMAGLGFATVLTLIGIPALYHTYLRAERRAENPVQATPENEPEVGVMTPSRLAAE